MPSVHHVRHLYLSCDSWILVFPNMLYSLIFFLLWLVSITNSINFLSSLIPELHVHVQVLKGFEQDLLVENSYFQEQVDLK